jgi:hypothetical protein
MFSKAPAGSLTRRLLLRQLRWLPRGRPDAHQANGEANEDVAPTESIEAGSDSTRGGLVEYKK